LPTRDAFLPILGVLLAMREAGVTLTELFNRLPARHSKAALLKNFPRPASLALVARFSPPNPNIRDVWFEQGSVRASDAHETSIPITESEAQSLLALADGLGRVFTPSEGFGRLARLNLTDGLRLSFDNGDVAHVRPSGNADELRIYAVADSAARAETIARMGIAEPDGLLRRLAAAT
jgi:phosphomannomutase